MKIAKGEKITLSGGGEVILTKVSRYGMRGIMDGKKVGSPTKITPIYRLYYRQQNGKQGHIDCAISPEEGEVVCDSQRAK